MLMDFVVRFQFVAAVGLVDRAMLDGELMHSEHIVVRSGFDQDRFVMACAAAARNCAVTRFWRTGPYP